jgi:hypothetical protein
MANSTRNSILHNNNPSEYQGDYQITEQALKNYGTIREKFGTTDILLPDSRNFNVKDYQYLLDNGNVGMYLIPINEYGVIKTPDGNEAWASQLVDTFVRQKMNIGEKDPMYALIYFIHPELNKNSISGFAQTEKVEMGITHLGAYYGQGVTSNSPPLYHNRRWGVEGEVYNNFGYPCNLVMIGLKEVNQSTLNKNFLIVDKFLNYGIRFPQDYKNSQFRMIDINTALMFYRDWIMEANYLKTDPSWFTYCAAHKTLVTTVALNLPHNRNAFMDAYGANEGSAFYDIFCKNHYEILGAEFTADLETNFEPLWKKENLTQAQIRPFTIDEYNAYDQARRQGLLGSFTGFKPLLPTQGTGWAPQSSADIIFNFVEAYADFIDAGAIASCATIMAYCDQVSLRMGIPKAEYLFISLPILELIMEANALAYAALALNINFELSNYYIQSFEGLYLGFGGKPENLPVALANFPNFKPFEGKQDQFIMFLIQQPDILPEYLAWWALGKVRENWSDIIEKPPLTIEEAYEWMKTNVKAKFDESKNLLAPTATGIEFNAPPAIVHMIEIGFFDKNPNVILKTLCTVMDYTELEPKLII